MNFVAFKWVAWAAAIAQAVLILETKASSCPGLFDILPLVTQIETTQACIDAQKYASQLLQSCQDIHSIEKCVNNSALLPHIIDSGTACAESLCKRRALKHIIEKLHHCDRTAYDYASEMLDSTCYLMPHDDCVQAKKLLSVGCKEDPLDVCKQKVSVLTKDLNCPATQYKLAETQFFRPSRSCPNSDDLSEMIEGIKQAADAANCNQINHFLSKLLEKCDHRQQDRVACLFFNAVNDSETMKTIQPCIGKLFSSAAFIPWSRFKDCNMSIESFVSSLDPIQCGAFCEAFNVTCSELIVAQEFCQAQIGQMVGELGFWRGSF